jgi:segregation and condensation protein B
MTAEPQAETRAALEALLLVAEEPLDPTLAAQLLEIPAQRVDALCQELVADYRADGRGFTLAKAAGGWRFVTHPDQAPYVERFVVEGQFTRMSSAALETLAVVAYKQPVSRAQVAAIRGVNVDGVMRTLLHRGLVAEIGRDSGPGQAVLFGTTPTFLERLGLDTLDDLPSLAELFPQSDVVEALEHGLRFPEDDSAARAEEVEEDTGSEEAASRAQGGDGGDADPTPVGVDDIDGG